MIERHGLDYYYIGKQYGDLFAKQAQQQLVQANQGNANNLPHHVFAIQFRFL